MKKYFILLLLVTFSPLLSVPFKDIFLKGEKGDFSVYQNGSYVTLLNIHSKDENYITFEEITLTKKLYKKIRGIKLNNWVRNGAIGNTSWTAIELDTKSLEVTSAYSFSKRVHLDLSKEDTLISSLLSLDVEKVPEEELPRIGPKRNTKEDNRLFWEPAMYVYGKRRYPKKMEVFGATWQKDNSPLSGREIDIYILDNFPFPFWIQIHGDFGSKKMISLDSGKHLISPIQDIPTMPPRFLSKLEKWSVDNSYSFLIKAGRAPSDFTLYFVEIGKTENRLLPMEAKYQKLDSGILKFNVSKSRLQQDLIKGKCYHLFLSYKEDDEIKSIASKDIIHWN